MTNNTLYDQADPHLDDYLRRAMTRGTQIRRRRTLAQLTLSVIAVLAVLVPLLTLEQSSPTPTHAAVNPAVAFRLVSWQHVAYPGLTLATAKYPVAIGCGPGFPGFSSDSGATSRICATHR